MNADAARTRLAYRQCESLTRAAARNFYYGIVLLPPHKRRAICAVYAYARRVDDIGDGALSPRRSCAGSTRSAPRCASSRPRTPIR